MIYDRCGEHEEFYSDKCAECAFAMLQYKDSRAITVK